MDITELAPKLRSVLVKDERVDCAWPRRLEVPATQVGRDCPSRDPALELVVDRRRNANLACKCEQMEGTCFVKVENGTRVTDNTSQSPAPFCRSAHETSSRWNCS